MEGPALGYRSTETFDQARSFRSRRLRSVAILAALIVAIIGAGSVQELFRRPETSENRDTSASRVPSDAKNIAVVASGPLTTQERDRDLTDGIRDGILSNLTKAADLKMVSGNSVERYRESEMKTEEIEGPVKVQDLAPGRGPKEKLPVRLTAEPNAKVASQALTDEKTLSKEHKKRVWIPKQIGSNLPGHWADANSAEARDAMTRGGFSVEDIRNRQDQTVSTMPTVFVGTK